ncbi:MAG TPA: tetratricopeptide repeat protein, partial [Chloroflexia bacterium]|nr:tetratricopeptide repeat protein [Chloroflexia bacterium]
MEQFSDAARNAAFGPRMLTLRTAMGLTQETVAAHLGVSRRTIGDWEAGNKYPKADHLKQFIVLAVQYRTFPAGREEAEIRALWRAARQKVLLDEAWLAALLAPPPVAESRVPAPTPIPAREAQLRMRDGSAGVSNLPLQPPPFFGRGAELVEIGRRLSDPACRLLTLIGPAGVGKTRLAVEVAASQAGRFRDGIVFVALASVGAPDQIVSTIGAALNLSFAGQVDPPARLLSYLRERHLLLVLDNFEHLLEGTHLVGAILERAAQVTLLVTSRERLDLRAEWLFDVEGLAYPPGDLAENDPGAQPILAELTRYSAVQLFVQRATQIQPGLPLTEATLAVIARICRQVAGLPLAIELAAAGARTLSVTEIEQQIRASLDALATPLRDVPARHRSMHAALDHSWRLLSEPEQVLFSRMGVFRGGCAAEAAEQVAGATFSALTALVNKSLLRESIPETRTLPGRAASNVAAELRFFLLEPIQKYALEKLAERGESEAAQRAHATYYLAWIEAAMSQEDRPPADMTIQQVAREYDNLRAALQWSRHRDHVTLGLRLAVALWPFWRAYGYTSEGRSWLDELLALANHPDTQALTARASALRTAAWLASDQHDYAQARQLFAESIALRRKLGETEGETGLLLNAARQARAAGQYGTATALLEEAVARQRAGGDRGTMATEGLGRSLYELGLVLREQGEFAGAAALFGESLELHRALGDREGRAAALLGLGDIARDQAAAPQVREYCAESLAIFRELGMQWAIGFALNNLALGAYLEGDLTQADALIRESVALFRSMQAEASLGEALITQGHVLRARGATAAADAAMSEALRLVQTRGPRLLVAIAVEGLAGLVAQ